MPNEKKRPAARSLKDLELKEDLWKPDFDIISRYQHFETEIIRLSLLGVAGYGFLISQVRMNDTKPIFQSLQYQKSLLMF